MDHSAPESPASSLDDENLTSLISEEIARRIRQEELNNDPNDETVAGLNLYCLFNN